MSEFNSLFISRRNFLRDATVASAGAAFAAGIRPVQTANAEGDKTGGVSFKNIYRQLHLDAHIGQYKKVFQNFDAEATAQILDEAGFQMVTYFAQDLYGYSYYPTKVGVVHPGLDRDYTGEMTKALKKRGISTIVYITAENERRYHKGRLRIPTDWIQNRNPSRVMVDDNKNDSRVVPCLNSPFVEEVSIPQFKEVLTLYDVDGFFSDGVRQWVGSPCYCKYCRESFKKEVGGDIPTDDSDPKAFAYRKWANRHLESYMDKFYHALSEIKQGTAILNNGVWMFQYPVTPPQYVKHICWDTATPDYALYTYSFSLQGRYLAALTDVLPDTTWSCMDIGGYSWTDYTMREPEAFMHESAILLAACGRTYLAENPHPSGINDKVIMDAYGVVNKRTKELEPFLKGCKPVKDVAVLHSEDSVWSKTPLKPHTSWTPSPAKYCVCGAHKALVEGHVQMGILNSDVLLKTIHNYKALILTDQRVLSKKECEEIRRFVRNGGALIATGETGLRYSDNIPLDNFSIADVLGVDYLGVSDSANSYLRLEEKIDTFGIPAYDYQVNGNYIRVKTTTAKTLIELVPPYEGQKNGSAPPAEHPEGPGVTINSYGKGKVIYCASRLFHAYFSEDTPNLRKLGLWMLDLVYPTDSRTILLEHTPINVEVFYNQRGDERFVHLINFNADRRSRGVPQVQDFSIVNGIKVKIRLKNKPASITSVPGGKNIAFTYRNMWASFDAEPLEIHSVYRIEC